MQVVQGRGAVDGIAIGSAVYHETRAQDVYRFPIEEAALAAEIGRLERAVVAAKADVDRIHQRLSERLGPELAAVFEAHGLILTDELLLERVRKEIRESKVNAEWALHQTVESLANEFAKIETEHLRERAQDLRDAESYLLTALQGISHHELSEIEGDVIVVADHLTPAETLRLGRQRVAGLALEGGGPNSHTIIVARAFRIPLVSGLGPIRNLLLENEHRAIIDGEAGELVLDPTPEVLDRYRNKLRQEHAQEDSLLSDATRPAATSDGRRIEVLANIEFPEEVDDVLRFGADGIGLYRSEFLYIEKSPELPSEEEHYETYRRMLEALSPRPVVIRTLDLGGRKLAREVLHTEEENPSLGLRGIRLTLTRPALFRTQLRALYRASAFGELSILVPLVSSLEEVLLFKALCREISESLRAEGHPVARNVRLGAMIEVPAAALVAGSILDQMDFLSIGTNDLIQYTLAVDRNNEHVAGLYQPFHPAILTLIQLVCEAAAARGKPVSVCGEVAADPAYTPVLVGAGLDSLSMAPRSIPRIKRRIRGLTSAQSKDILQQCTKITRFHEVERLLRGEWRKARSRDSDAKRRRSPGRRASITLRTGSGELTP